MDRQKVKSLVDKFKDGNWDSIADFKFIIVDSNEIEMLQEIFISGPQKIDDDYMCFLKYSGPIRLTTYNFAENSFHGLSMMISSISHSIELYAKKNKIKFRSFEDKSNKDCECEDIDVDKFLSIMFPNFNKISELD